jgi:hypothetical protein
LDTWIKEVGSNGNPTKVEMVVAQFDDLTPFEKLTTVEPVPHKIRVWKYGLNLLTTLSKQGACWLGPKYIVDFPIIGYHLVGRKTKYGYFLGSDNDDKDQQPAGYFKITLEKSGKDSVV